MDYEQILAPPLKNKIYHPIGVQSLYNLNSCNEKIATTYLKCYFRPCKGTAFIKNEKLVMTTPCPEAHPEVDDLILESRKKTALLKALETKSEHTTMKEWYEDALKK